MRFGVATAIVCLCLVSATYATPTRRRIVPPSCANGFREALTQLRAQYPELALKVDDRANGSLSIGVGERFDQGPVCYFGSVVLTDASDEAWHPQFNKAYSGFDEMELRRKGGLEGFVGTRDRNDGKRAQRFRAVVEAAIDRCLDRK